MVERQNQSPTFKRLGYQRPGNESIIGQTIADNKTNEQIFYDTGLTFDVHTVPLVADTAKCDTIQSTGYIDVPNAKALINGITGTVGRKFTSITDSIREGFGSMGKGDKKRFTVIC